jgi:hypothetical protein
MSRLFHSTISAFVACAAVTVLAAQTPTTQPPPPDTQTPSTETSRRVTAVGCLKQQKDIPAPSTNVDERIGADDDFVLMDARITSAAPATAPTAPSEKPPSETARTTSPDGNITVHSKTMYKVVGMPEAELREHLNHQVEIQAMLDVARLSDPTVRQPAADAGREPASAPTSSSPPAQAPGAQSVRPELKPVALPELRVTAIKSLGGTCKGT